MRLLSPWVTRRAAVLTWPSMLTASLFTAPSWLSSAEQSLLDECSNKKVVGDSLTELQRTSFQSIRQAVGDAQVVLIGEATHGTEEFYRIRADLTRSLLTEQGFDAVLCEGDFAPFFQVNRFVGGAPPRRELRPENMSKAPVPAAASSMATVDDALACFGDRFPKWMWRNNVMRDFLSWLQQFNNNRKESTQMPVVQLLGLDIYSLFQSMDQVIDYLEEAGEPELARLARQRYSTLESFRPDPKDYSLWAAEAATKRDSTLVKKKVARMLTHLYAQENRLSQVPGNGQELFNAVQNARVVAAAEAYFRNLIAEEDDTWNLRDSAFLDCIQNVMAYVEKRGKGEAGSSGKRKARVAVWAHNSHIGDASATEYANYGHHNLGQLCRQAFGRENVYIVGFSTFEGTVRAASQWGDRDRVMELNPAIEGSHEYLLHLLARKRRQNAFGFTLRSNSGPLLVDEPARALLQMDRVERFVGVEYLPDTESRSHYATCNMSDEFDYIFHVDRSSALAVDQVREVVENEKMVLLDKYGEDYEELAKRQ